MKFDFESLILPVNKSDVKINAVFVHFEKFILGSVNPLKKLPKASSCLILDFFFDLIISLKSFTILLPSSITMIEHKIWNKWKPWIRKI